MNCRKIFLLNATGENLSLMVVLAGALSAPRPTRPTVPTRSRLLLSNTRQKGLTSMPWLAINVSHPSSFIFSYLKPFIILDLADRFRNLTFSCTQVSLLRTGLSMAETHYDASIYAFARDIITASQDHGRQSHYWLQVGLCKTEEQVTELWEIIDNFVENADDQGIDNDVLSERAHNAHNDLLRLLSHLHDLPIPELAPLLDAPSLESKHAPFVGYTVPKKPRAPRKPKAKTKGKASSKGKGKGKAKAKEPTLPSTLRRNMTCRG